MIIYLIGLFITFSDGNGIVLSPGLVLRKLNTPLVFYDNFVMQTFPVKFRFSDKHDSLFAKYHAFCDERTSAICQIINSLTATLNNLDGRVRAFSNDSLFSSDSVDHIVYRFDIPSNRQAPMLEDSSEEETQLLLSGLPVNGTANSEAQIPRVRRQFVTLAIIFGAMVMSQWYSSSSSQDYTPVVNELRQRVDETQRALIQAVEKIREYNTIQAHNLTAFATRTSEDLEKLTENEAELNRRISKVIKGDQKFLLLIHYFLNIFSRFFEIYQFQATLDACKLGILPNLVVNPDVLKTSLLKLQGNLRAHSYTLSISPHDLNRYYSLKLTKCKINVRTNEITVFLNTPIMPANTLYTLFESISLPFQLNGNKICTLPSYSEYILKINDDFVPFSEKSKLCNHADSLCNINPFYIQENIHENECMSQLLEDIHISNMTLCRLNCLPIKINKTIIKELENRKYLVLSTANVTIRCRDPQVAKKLPSLIHTVGVHVVSLPCQCSILQDQKVIVGISVPCYNGPPTIAANLILPPLWVNTPAEVHFEIPTTESLTSGRNTYQNLSAILKPDSTFSVPDSVPVPTDPKLWSTVVLNHHQLFPTYMLVAWNACLSLGFLYLIRKFTSVPLPLFAAIPGSHSFPLPATPLEAVENAVTNTIACDVLPALLRHHLVMALIIFTLITLCGCSSCLCVFCTSKKRTYIKCGNVGSSETELQPMTQNRRNVQYASAVNIHNPSGLYPKASAPRLP